MLSFQRVIAFCLLNVVLVNCQLYFEGDRVTIFDPDSFLKTFNQRPSQSWLIQFYSSFCGHCINFSPKFKQFLQEAQHWSQVVKFGVVDCSAYAELCNSQKIMFYPSFKMFPSKEFPGFPIKGVNLKLDHTSLPKFFKTVINQIQILLKPAVLIESRSDEGIDGSQFFLLLGSDVVALKRTILTFGGRLIHPIYYRYDASRAGFDVVLSTGENTTTRSEEHLSGLYKWLHNYLRLGQTPVDESPSTNPNRTTNNKIKPEGPKITPPVYNQDIYSSIYYSFVNEIDDHILTNVRNIVVLRNFVKTLYLYSDINEQITGGFQALMDLLQMKIDEMNLRSKFPISWSDILRRSKLPVIEPKWVGCNGSQPHLRRYPCGLWTLFHTLTVNQFLKVKDGDVEDDSLGLIGSIRAFIFTFFKCKECAVNFKSETKDYKSFATSSPKAIIYLWLVHNSVNKRLSGALSDDPAFPKIAFPTKFSCRPCRHNLKIKWPKNNQWDFDQVLYFLVYHYSDRIPFDTPTVL